MIGIVGCKDLPFDPLGGGGTGGGNSDRDSIWIDPWDHDDSTDIDPCDSLEGDRGGWEDDDEGEGDSLVVTKNLLLGRG